MDLKLALKIMSALLVLFIMATSTPSLAQDEQQAQDELNEKYNMDIIPNSDFDVDEMLGTVNRFLESKAWAEAIRMLQNAIEKNPDKVFEITPNHFISVIHYAHNKYSQFPADAIDIYRNQLNYEIPAKQLFKTALTEAAPEMLKRIITLYYLSSITDNALVMLGDTYFEDANFRMALSCWEKAIFEFPDPDVDKAYVSIKIAVARKYLEMDTDESMIKKYKERFGAQEIQLEENKKIKGITLLEKTLSGIKANNAGSSPEDIAGIPDIKRPLLKWSRSYRGIMMPELELNPNEFKAIITVKEEENYGNDPFSRMRRAMAAEKMLPQASRELWESGLPAPVIPTIYNNSVYFKINAVIYKMDIKTGIITWVYPQNTKSDLSASHSTDVTKTLTGIQITKDKIYFSHEDVFSAKPIGIDLTTGKPIMPDSIDPKIREYFSSSRIVSPPVIIGKTIYYVLYSPSEIHNNSIDYNLCALDTENGKLIWRTKLYSQMPSQDGGGMFGGMMAFRGARTTPASPKNAISLCQSGGTLFINGNNGTISAIDALTGNMKWLTKYSIGPKQWQNIVNTSKINMDVASNGVLIITPSDSPYIYALDMATGKELWKTTEFTFVLGIRYHIAYLAGPDKICACDLSKGPKLSKEEGFWTAQITKEASEKFWRGIISDKYLLHPTSKFIYVFDINSGKPLQKLVMQSEEQPLFMQPTAEGLLISWHSKIALLSDAGYEAALENDIKNNPGDINLLVQRATLKFSNMNLEEAQKDFESIYNKIKNLEGEDNEKIKSYCAMRLYQLYLSLAETNRESDIARSEAYYNLAIGITDNPNSKVSSYLRLFSLMKDKEMATKAADILQIIIEQYPGTSAIFAEKEIIGKSYCVDRLEKLLEKFGQEHYAKHDQKALQIIEEARKNSDAALAEKTINIYQNSIHIQKAYLLLSELVLARGDKTAAMKLLHECLVHHPSQENEASLFFGISIIYKKLDNPNLEQVALRYLDEYHKGKNISFAGMNTTVDQYCKENLKSTSPVLGLGFTRQHISINTLPVKRWEAESTPENSLWLETTGEISPEFGKRIFEFRNSHIIECHDATSGKTLWKAAQIIPGAYLGVYHSQSNQPPGVQIDRVLPNSAATNSGIQQGDILTELDGEKITDVNIFAATIKSMNVGQPVKLTISRQGKEFVLDVILGSQQPVSVLASHVDGDKLITVMNSAIICNSIKDGKQLWSYSLGGYYNASSMQFNIAQGIIALIMNSNTYVIDMQTGIKLWERSFDAQNNRRGFQHAPVISNHNVIFFLNNATIEAYNILTGRISFKASDSGLAPTGSWISAGNKLLYWTDNTLKAIDLSTGKKISAEPAPKPINFLFTDGKYILAGKGDPRNRNLNNEFIFINAVDGKETGTIKEAISAVAMDSKICYAYTRSELIAVDYTTNKELWRSKPDEPLAGAISISISDKFIVLIGNTGQMQSLAIFDRATGKQVHSEKFQSTFNIANRPAPSFQLLDNGWFIKDGKKVTYYGK